MVWQLKLVKCFGFKPGILASTRRTRIVRFVPLVIDHNPGYKS